MKALFLGLVLLLSGCAHLRDNISDAAGVVTGVATTAATGNVYAGLAVGGATSAGVNLVTQPEESVADVIEQLPEEERAKVLKHEQTWEAVEELGMVLIVAAAFVLIVLLWLPPPQTWFRRRNHAETNTTD